MKMSFSLFVAVALTLLAQSLALSQITITASDVPNYLGAGSSLFIYSTMDTVAMDIGVATDSVSQTWTAPAVTFTDSLRTDNVDPASTPYFADFPGAIYAEKMRQSGAGVTIETYEYFEVSNDSVLEMGFVNHDSGTAGNYEIDTSIVYNNIKLYFPLPLQVGDAYTVSTDTTNLGGGNVLLLNTEATIDAYGTLILPKGSFGALRSSEVTTSTQYFKGKVVLSSTTRSITWYTMEGYELTVGVDSGSVGPVMVHSVTVAYPGKTPATVVVTSPREPRDFALAQNYPNPFNPTTVISYQLSAVSNVSLKVYDVLGREVATLVNEKQNAGSYSLTFNGSPLPSGVYFYRLVAGSFSSVKKLILLK